MDAGGKRRLGLRTFLIERNRLLAAASLQRLGPAMPIHDEILQRRQKKRAQAPLLLVGPAQGIPFDEMFEETLDDVLRIGWRIAAPPDEGVERRPIGFAENGKRPSRGFIRAGLSCLQHDGPVRRLKRRASLL